MSIFPSFLRSLFLTTILSFAAPILLVGGGLAVVSLVGYIPGLAAMGQAGVAQILQFLATFGTGCPLQGILVIGWTCSFVGGLFDTYAFYRYQSLSGN
ncbi:MAG: hypothetical protein KME08_14685 [Aphanothece sp. CMT-3BRIN-NPC111]|jgi:hypothetical protein|nr:hypothetical protein [Aphanothece sp. CMT-3BRIN-NPC111]